MRASIVLAFTFLTLLAGCGEGGLDQDRAYRRLFDQFDSYDQCIADKAVVSCYQTFVVCANGRVLVDLDNRPQDGIYELEGDSIVNAHVAGDLIVFDMDRRFSAQLPGRHSWELANPSFTGCDVTE